MRAVSAIVVATLVALGSAATARANDVTFTFDSTVSRNLGFGVPLGTDYLFSYTIDTSEAPISLATGSASYDVASATVTVDGQTLSASNGSLSIDYAPATSSSSGSGFYFVHFTEPDGGPFGTINGVNVLSLNLRFISDSGTMLQNSGLSIPTTAAFATLATFDQADFDGPLLLCRSRRRRALHVHGFRPRALEPATSGNRRRQCGDRGPSAGKPENRD
jgi:hypothetical protein